jgi:antitoxin CptB
MLIGGFFDRHGQGWSDDEAGWFETLLEEQDVDIMAWALGTAQAPERFEGTMMGRMRQLDYIEHLK